MKYAWILIWVVLILYFIAAYIERKRWHKDMPPELTEDQYEMSFEDFRELVLERRIDLERALNKHNELQKKIFTVYIIAQTILFVAIVIVIGITNGM